MTQSRPDSTPARPFAIVCVLAGGESRRFGRSKLHVTVGAEPVLQFLRRSLEAWQPLGQPAQFWLNLPFGNTPTPPGTDGYSRIIRDDLPFQGPLQGIATVLRHADGAGPTAFVPADMPAVSPDMLQRLWSAITQQHNVDRACYQQIDPTFADGVRLEPLPLVVERSGATRTVEHALSRGIRGPSGLMRSAGAALIDADPAVSRRLISINTPLDLSPMEQVLALEVRG